MTEMNKHEKKILEIINKAIHPLRYFFADRIDQLLLLNEDRDKVINYIYKPFEYKEEELMTIINKQIYNEMKRRQVTVKKYKGMVTSFKNYEILRKKAL